MYALVISLALGAVSAPPSYAERVLHELYLRDIELSQTPVELWDIPKRTRGTYYPPSPPRPKMYIDNRQPYAPHYDKPIQVQPTWNQIPYRKMKCGSRW